MAMPLEGIRVIVWTIPAPELGQHSEEILIDLLDYDRDRIANLRRQEVI